MGNTVIAVVALIVLPIAALVWLFGRGASRVNVTLNRKIYERERSLQPWEEE